MIQFDSASTIYLQVADFMTEQILTEAWPEQERIPSIRELAALVQVNPNTVMRSFAYLQDNDIISNRRGVGYFVNKHGKQTVQALKKVALLTPNCRVSSMRPPYWRSPQMNYVNCITSF